MGYYSDDIPKETAKLLVKNPKHKAFQNPFNRFWFSEDDKKLHYGKTGLEGTLTLNEKGKRVFKHTRFF